MATHTNPHQNGRMEVQGRTEESYTDESLQAQQGTVTRHDPQTGPWAAPYDHRLSAIQELSFDHAEQTFATAGMTWDESRLSDLHILDENRHYTNTGLLLSDQCPFSIKMTIFASDMKSKVVEKRTLTGSTLSQLDEAVMLLNEHDVDRRWPSQALRESLVNAVVHRDYDMNGPTVINIFPSRIEIVSLGGLVGGLEVNDLLNGVNMPRNPYLASLFSRLGISEDCGTGIRRILESYGDSLASPQVRVGPRSVAMVLPASVREPLTGGDERNDETRSDTNDIDGFDDSGRSEQSRELHAKRYAFPTAHPYITDDPGSALAGARVIAVAPLQTLVLSGDLSGNQRTGAELETSSTDGSRTYDQPGHAKKQREPALPGYELDELEAVALHLFAGRGVQLTRKQVEHSLGLNRKEAKKLLHTLTDAGRLEHLGEPGKGTYKLAKA
ncbi:ATP-binding protein [Bifidobacterium bombi]|nr:ATP-binding protein [Bifidobacterium bombi]